MWILTCIDLKSPDALAANMADPSNTDSVASGKTIGKPVH